MVNQRIVISALHLYVKGVDLTGLLGGHKRTGSLGDRVPQWGPGAEPQ